MSALEKSMHLGRLPSRPPLPGSGGSQSGAKMRMGPGRKRDFTPVPWSQYFESMEDVEVENETGKDTFRVYKSGSEGPVLLLVPHQVRNLAQNLCHVMRVMEQENISVVSAEVSMIPKTTLDLDEKQALQTLKQNQ